MCLSRWLRGKMTDAPGVQGFDNWDLIEMGMERLHSIPAAKSTGRHHVMFSVVAFGDVDRRSLLLECIRYALEPTLVHSAYVKPVDTREFEVIVLSTKKVDMKLVEEWLTEFNMSVCVIEFQHYMQADMVSCISRIHHLGKERETNFGFQIAAKIRRDFHKEYNKREKAARERRLRDETGMTFTIENMFVLHARVLVLQRNFRRLEQQLIAERAAADRCRRCGIAAERLADAQTQTVSM
jgi:hypothetical protein